MGGNQVKRRGKRREKEKEMRRNDTLYISDLDGTLLNSQSEVSDASAEMLNEAIAEGALFSIATARTPCTVARIMEKVKSRLPYIVMTGVAGWNPEDGSYTHKQTIPAEEAEHILNIFRSHSVPVFVYCLRGNMIHVYHSGPLSDEEREFMKGREGRYKTFHVPADGCSELPEHLGDVALFYSIQPTELSRPAYLEIKRECRCNPLFYHDIYGEETAVLEVFSSKASKAEAIGWLRKSTGARRVVVFGDNVNDIPMMREADLSVAVGNAIPEVKEIADIIIGKNTDDSVARFILTDYQFSTHEI